MTFLTESELVSKQRFIQSRCFQFQYTATQHLRTTWCVEVKGIYQRAYVYWVHWSLFQGVWIYILSVVAKETVFAVEKHVYVLFQWVVCISIGHQLVQHVADFALINIHHSLLLGTIPYIGIITISTPTDCCALICVFLDYMLPIIRHFTDPIKQRCYDILKLPFLKETLRTIVFLLMTQL